MAYPTGTNSPGGTPGAAAPNVAYTGTFIPAIWSGKLLEKFYDATVLAAISNTDYQGEISSMGDKVIIRTKPTITIQDYVADQTLVTERPSSNVVELLIDKGKYFATILDDVMEIQSDLNQMGMWADDASEQMKINIDTQVLGAIYPDIAVANVGATAGRISGNINLGAASAPLELVGRNAQAGLEVEVVDALIRMGQVLDEQNIPETGRWAIIPAWFSSLIKASDLREAQISGDAVSIMRNGRLGMIDRFTLYTSNLLPTAVEGGGDATYIFAGHSHGLAFASQLTKMETLRGESTFGTIMRGLQIYGFKVVDGTALTALYARKSVVPAP